MFVPPGAKQSSSSLLDCFFQINIFPKDLNPKQQPRLESNTTQKFRSRSSVIQLLQVLGMVQSMVVYSIAKMFTQSLCLYTASYTCKHRESVETSTALFRRYCFGGFGFHSTTRNNLKTSQHRRCMRVKVVVFCHKRLIS